MSDDLPLPTEATLQRTKLLLRAREHLEAAQTTADAVAALRPLVDAGLPWGSTLKARYLERLGQIRTREAKPLTPEEIEDVRRDSGNSLRDYRLLATIDRLRAALETVRAWDCLNPPRADLLVDLPWLRSVVDAALDGKEQP